jgi:TRAP transporter 4TM/12TM fusion protein
VSSNNQNQSHEYNTEDFDDEIGPKKKRELLKGLNRFVTVVAVLLSLFHLYTAFFGVFPGFTQRAVHFGLALILVFAIYKPAKRLNQKTIPWYDWILILLAVIVTVYFTVNSVSISSRLSYIMPLTTMQVVLGIIMMILTLEATRRTTGNALMIIMLTGIVYSFVGHLVPGFLSHREFDLMWIMDHMFFTTNALFGIPLGVSATFIALFILFGKFLELSGGGNFFINLANAAMGKYRGGPAKAAIVGSSLMGTISGSAVANTVTTGSFTIPLMKKMGYRKEFAGAVEAVASSGGQIMPPIMGASAFIIASYVGVPYIEIAIAAIIPALLYYVCLFTQVDLRAKRRGLRGMSENEVPHFWKVLKHGFLFFLPLIVIVYMLVLGYSPMRAGLFAIAAIIVVAMLKASTRLTFPKLLKILDFGARGMLETAIATGAAGIVIGAIGLTGIGLKFTGIIIDLAGGSLILTLIFTMVTSIILGMGLPTVAAYIVQVALTVPALVEMGVTPIAAHMFIFYFAILSAITPPVALAAFAAAGIAGSDPMKTGFNALRLGIAAFIVPFIFVYGNEILLMGDVVSIIIATFTSIVGIFFIAVAVEGWLFRHARWYERVIFAAGSILLISTDQITDIIGIALLVTGFLIHKFTFTNEANDIAADGANNTF